MAVKHTKPSGKTPAHLRLDRSRHAPLRPRDIAFESLLGQLYGYYGGVLSLRRKTRAHVDDLRRGAMVRAEMLKAHRAMRRAMMTEPLHARLSPRELQVFTRIALGIRPMAMANEFGLNVKTVSTYRARILDKMGMHSNAEIAAYAATLGLPRDD